MVLTCSFALAALATAFSGPDRGALPVRAAESASPCAMPASQLAAATPVASGAATPKATGAASPAATSGKAMATPVGSAENGTSDLAEELTSVSRALAACLSRGDAATVALLVTDDWLGEFFGGVDMTREQYISLSPGLGEMPIEIVSVSEARPEGNGTAAAVVEYTTGRQLSRSVWSYATAPLAERKTGETIWRVDGESPLSVEPPKGATSIDATLSEFKIELSADTVKGGSVAISGKNVGAIDHEMLVLRLAPDYTVDELLRAAGPGLPPEAEWIAQQTVPAGKSEELVMTGLKPGAYWIICMFPMPDGTPHAAMGQVTSLTVE
ncbi:MAG: hypothetical protein ACR2J8_05565 [Thermomicrobiales bacterium]